MSSDFEAGSLNMRATYYIPQELDMRMEQLLLDLRLTHGVKVSKSELVRGALDMLMSLGPAKVYELLA